MNEKQLDQDDKVLLTVRDVTRQKKILDELEEARRNAESENADMKSEL